ncbi:hypothetical protein EFE32_06385 [Lactococcus lactis subsp. lactis]|uniref:Eco57I restriction-modification methylase domain-containing protein n=1 Tax=Lactococcus lactis TaxID=1358 RepID=UPI00223B057F|nr:hypothetical protein [Lactococcus lactis]MCT0016477.1 hypothetical protein [Lactococcus lactis subsp. lactis]
MSTKKCQVFTPSEYAKELLDRINYCGPEILEKTFLENSVGEGHILIEAIRRFLDEAKKLSIGGGILKRKLEKSFIAFEIDSEVSKTCRKNLDEIIKDYGYTITVSWNIIEKNYLYYTMDTNVDYIVGNPPYINYTELDSEERNYLKNNFYSCSKGKFDYCYAFIEKSLLDLEMRSGKMAYFIPSSIFKNTFGENLRQLMKKNLVEIVDFPYRRVFEKALASPAMIIFNRKVENQDILYLDRDQNRSILIDKLRLVGKWIFSNKIKIESEQTVKFGDLFSVTNSVATLLNEAFVVKKGSTKIENEVLRKAVSPRGLAYGIEEEIIFPYYYNTDREWKRYSESEFIEKFPNAVNHLELFIDKLRKRKADGESLVSALTTNVSSAEEIINDLQEGVNHLTSQLDNPSSGLSGKAYHAANTLFKQIVVPTLSELKNATTTIQSELSTYSSAIKAFDRYPDSVYDKEEFERLLNIKRQQKALTENHINIFMQALNTAVAKTATENLIFEGKGLESVVNHYEKEIHELEDKIQILETVEGQTSSLFEHSLQDFQQALQGAKALKQGSFDSKVNFTFNKNQDMSWYKKLTGKDVNDSLISKKADEITLEDLLTGNVSKENQDTLEHLKKLAEATGLSLEAVWKLFVKDKKHEFNENYQMLKNFINYGQNEWDKAFDDPTIHDNDKISTIVVSYEYGGIDYTVGYVINETTGELIEQPTNSPLSGLLALLGGVDDGTTDDRLDPVKKIQLAIGGNFSSATGILGSLKTSERDTITGKEYLDDKNLEKELAKEKEEIRRKQELSNSSLNWNGSILNK